MNIDLINLDNTKKIGSTYLLLIDRSMKCLRYSYAIIRIKFNDTIVF
jgi:hypothetical protein